MILWQTWPEVPLIQRPRMLYYSSKLEPAELDYLEALGWTPTDVRLMPSSNAQERAAAILAWLEGVRLGSIEADPTRTKFIELEMRACGLHAGKVEEEAKSSLSDKDVDALLDFSRK